jgi:LuxR family transcriptional regulator, maltose regulon positive regulatory protein
VAGAAPDAARLLADHSFSLTLDGQAQTIQALVRAFPQGAAADDPELALVRAAERALSLAEPDRLVLPFAMTGAGELLEALPRHQTAHAALLTDVLDVVHGASLPANDQLHRRQQRSSAQVSFRVLRYLPTNLSRPEIAREPSVSVNTVNTHVRSIYAKLQARDRSSAVQRARQLRLLSTGLTR